MGSPPPFLHTEHNRRTRYAVLLVHTGGPRDVSWWEVWRYLSIKLSEKRLVEPIPGWLWAPFLYLFVLPSHVHRVQQAQKSMWIRHRDTAVDAYVHPERISARGMADTTAPGCSPPPETPRVSSAPTAGGTPLGSPASSTDSSQDRLPLGYSPSVYYTAKLCDKVQQQLTRRLLDRDDVSVQVECAFLYQQNSIDDALDRFQLLGNYSGVCDSSGRPSVVKEEQLIVLPLFPQYHPVSTAAAYDAVMKAPLFRNSLKIPHVHFRSSYCVNAHYIVALERQVRQFFGLHGPPSWLFVVFPSSIKSTMGANPVYEAECYRTFAYLRRALGQPRGGAALLHSSSACSFCSQHSSGRTASHQVPAAGAGAGAGAGADSSSSEFPPTGRNYPSSSEYELAGNGVGAGVEAASYERAFPVARIRMMFLSQDGVEDFEDGETEREGRRSASSSRGLQYTPSEVLHKAVQAERTDGIGICGGEEGGAPPAVSRGTTPRGAGLPMSSTVRQRSSVLSGPGGAQQQQEEQEGSPQAAVPCQSAASTSTPRHSQQIVPSNGKVYVICPGTVVEDVNPLITLQANLFVWCSRLWRQVEYIPALNDCQVHTDLILELLAEWVQVD